MPPLQPPALVPRGAVRVIDRLLSRERRDTCTIQRPVAQEDVAGAAMENAWYTVGVVDCEVGDPQGGAETQIAARYGPQATYAVSLPRSAPIRSSDRILVNGATLEVVHAQDIHTSGMDQVIITVERG